MVSINRIKVILVEMKKIGGWQIKMGRLGTVSKWYTSTT